MNINTLKTSASLIALSLILTTQNVSSQELPSSEEMWKLIQQQQAQITALEKMMGITQQTAIENKEKVEVTEKMIEATVTAIEEGSMASAGPSTNGTSLGGYAEMHFNGGETDQIDFHRFVMFMGHEFTDKIRFFSELEVEHSLSGNGKPGEVELEQAFVEFDIAENTYASVGLQLVPVGIINETHEPPTFYGVERNNVEKNIIPATWWEAGVKFSGKLDDSVRYDAMVHSGLKTPITGQSGAFNIRSGRQKVAKASWKNTAYTGRLSWMAAPGVTFGASFQYQSDLTQTSAEPTSATLIEAHADIQHQLSTNSQLGLRALYAQWNLDSTEAELLGKDIQKGWYIEPSYKYNIDSEQSIGIFARYSMWDNTAGSAIDTANKQTSFGLNYWPHENVVLKADYQIDNYANITKEDNRVNLGLGLQF
ncbi:MAG: porin [Kordiimonadaceae bacterium]|nr:porin [Kordiimonadaceae bacterium]